MILKIGIQGDTLWISIYWKQNHYNVFKKAQRPLEQFLSLLILSLILNGEDPSHVTSPKRR